MIKKTETQEILELLTSFIGYSEKQFDKIFKRFEQMDKRFKQIDERFTGVDERFNGVDIRFDGIELQHKKMQAQLDGLQASIDRLESKKKDRSSGDDLEDRIEEVESDIVKIKKTIYH